MTGTSSLPPAAMTGNSLGALGPAVSSSTVQPPRSSNEQGHVTDVNALAPVRDRALDDINFARRQRNERRDTRRRNGDANVSDDEDFIDPSQLSSLYDASAQRPDPLPPSATDRENLTLPDPTISPTIQSPVGSTPSPIEQTTRYAFTDEDAHRNDQEPMLYTIPDQILEMFKNRVYIPMSMFLINNMERIRIDQDLKTHKAQGMRVIDASNFVDEKSLDYYHYSQAYHNFLRCMEVCMPPGSTLPQAWDQHFVGASQDPRMTADFRVFVLLDIRMRQQLVDKPFKPEPSSAIYRDAYDLAAARISQEDKEAQWAVIRQHTSGGPSRPPPHRRERSFSPYPDPVVHRNGASPSTFSNSQPFRPGGGLRGTGRPPQICLKCGQRDSHYASGCPAQHSFYKADRRPVVSAQGRKLVFISDNTTPCFNFNLDKPCTDVGPSHPIHRCTICASSQHGAMQCARN
jgi:hypothetical protein